MKKLSSQLLLFIIPFILMVINYQNYEVSGGDLNRVGKISVEEGYRRKFDKSYGMKRKYRNLSEIDLNKKDTFDVLSIGDSFSQLGECGYQNYLAHLYGLEILNIDGAYNMKNPIQNLISMVNGNIFDNLKVEYIILESVEREAVTRAIAANRNTVVNVSTFNDSFLIKSASENAVSPGFDFGVFTDLFNNTICQNIVDYNYYNLMYNFDGKAYYSESYKLQLNRKLFSTKKNELMFYYEDVDKIMHVSTQSVEKVNDELNDLTRKLKDKGIKLIVLVCPDKYDMYSKFIVENSLPKNNFFEYMAAVKKDYIFIDSKPLLLKHIEAGVTDVYYADDTHWSPISSKIIAEDIHEKMENGSR